MSEGALGNYTERLKYFRIPSWHGRPGRAHGRDARATIYVAVYIPTRKTPSHAPPVWPLLPARKRGALIITTDQIEEAVNILDACLNDLRRQSLVHKQKRGTISGPPLRLLSVFCAVLTSAERQTRCAPQERCVVLPYVCVPGGVISPADRMIPFLLL